jgi:hypothetical protein
VLGKGLSWEGRLEEIRMGQTGEERGREEEETKEAGDGEKEEGKEEGHYKEVEAGWREGLWFCIVNVLPMTIC